MRRSDVVGAGVGSGLIGAVLFGVVALLAVQFQLGTAVHVYVVGGAAAIGALLFALIGRGAAKRLPDTGRARRSARP